MAWFEEREDKIFLNIRVIPRAARDGVQEVIGDALKIRLQAPPVEGQANAALIKFIAKQFGIPRSSIQIVSGETNRNKRLCISPLTEHFKKELLSLNPE
jgi:uncharacterized protein